MIESLAAIYNVYDGVELLRGSMQCLRGHVEHFIIVYQEVSNYGEKDYTPYAEIRECTHDFENVHLIYYQPELIKSQRAGRMNEAKKRNRGIQVAIQLKCTHFINLDVDEYYANFQKGKELFEAANQEGTVCRMHTYFRHANLRIEPMENYYVPFIHELRKDSVVGGWPNYPYHCDPTRRPNTKSVVEIPFLMHHFSWVRKDIARKARNSSARNLMQHLTDWKDAKPGMRLKAYEGQLVECENIFNIQI